MKVQHKVTPFLWFNANAAEAARFYVSLFKDSELLHTDPMSARFRLAGQDYIAFNGGPQYPHTDAFSMFVDCEDQAEVDHYWDALLAGGGKPTMCGWLKDRFGLSWQVVPAQLFVLMSDPVRERAQRVQQAMRTMVKLDVAALQRAANGETP